MTSRIRACKDTPVNRFRFGEPSDIVAQLSRLIAIVRNSLARNVEQWVESGLVQITQVFLVFLEHGFAANPIPPRDRALGFGKQFKTG